MVNDYKAVEPLYKLEGMTVTLNFSLDNLEYLRGKFKIEDKEDLLDAIYECISTYMEL